MIGEIRALPLGSRGEFLGDSRNVWAAESCLRRAREALFDMGRHILAKGCGEAVTEYKMIATKLDGRQVLSAGELDLMRRSVGYRNRLVHYYHNVGEEELYEIRAFRQGNVERIADALRSWLVNHPGALDETL